MPSEYKPLEYKPPEYKLPKICLKVSISQGLILGILRYLPVLEYLIGRNFRQVKFSSPNEKFVTFARQTFAR